MVVHISENEVFNYQPLKTEDLSRSMRVAIGFGGSTLLAQVRGVVGIDHIQFKQEIDADTGIYQNGSEWVDLSEPDVTLLAHPQSTLPGLELHENPLPSSNYRLQHAATAAIAHARV